MDCLDKLAGRVLPKNRTPIVFGVTADGGTERYRVTFEDGALRVCANTIVAAAHGLYRYLQDICRVNLSWNGNRNIELEALLPFDGEIAGEIRQKYRVYMNYCTLSYSMAWWDFERWEKELDFMALNGINMPLTVIGTEAVWLETLQQFGYNEEEALKTVSNTAFWAWQLMTNIDGYFPPENARYVYERLDLGRKIMARTLELGMTPIQQGFSGHVPMDFTQKNPNARVSVKRPWCEFPPTAQLDPLDEIFAAFGRAYLENQRRLLGAHGFYAADPFHENAPPVKGARYQKKVGRAIDAMMQAFEPGCVWVMQAWSLRKHIAKAVPRGNLLILDINSAKYKRCRYFWGHDYVLGMLHNFGGKNAMQGRLSVYTENLYDRAAIRGKNVVGTGLFMEGIDQNPIVYELQFRMLTQCGDIDLPAFVRDYIERRYGVRTAGLERVFAVLCDTCYANRGQQDNAVGSTVTARPDYLPAKASPCDENKPYYDQTRLQEAVRLMAAESRDGLKDGFAFDLTDLTRQAMSDLFWLNQIAYKKAADEKDCGAARRIADKQLELLADLDELTGYRSELCLSRWINDAHRLATDEAERVLFDRCARTQITLWGDVNGEDAVLFDYAWKEWNGLIREYYLPRWRFFYERSLRALDKGAKVDTVSGKRFFGRPVHRANDFYKELAEFERKWCETYTEMPAPQDRDPLPCVKRLSEKWFQR